jgi:hypothetical protein
MVDEKYLLKPYLHRGSDGLLEISDHERNVQGSTDDHKHVALGHVRGNIILVGQVVRGHRKT